MSTLVYDPIKGEYHRPIPILPLTAQQMQVIVHVCKGLSNKEIACHLNTTEQVIKNYLRIAYQKMGVSSRHAAMVYAIKAGWASI